MDLSDPEIQKAARDVDWVMIYRICGEIAVSRSIGDPDYKNFIPGQNVTAWFDWPQGHEQVSE